MRKTYIRKLVVYVKHPIVKASTLGTAKIDTIKFLNNGVFFLNGGLIVSSSNAVDILLADNPKSYRAAINGS